MHVFWTSGIAPAPHRRVRVGAPGSSGRGHTHIHIPTMGASGALHTKAVGGVSKFAERLLFLPKLYMAKKRVIV